MAGSGKNLCIYYRIQNPEESAAVDAGGAVDNRLCWEGVMMVPIGGYDAVVSPSAVWLKLLAKVSVKEIT
jgi:hypothetical protein